MAISNVEIEVDQATFDNWAHSVSALTHPLFIPITVVNPLPPSFAVPPGITFTGMDLLFEIGRACSRPEALDDPGRLFAFFRYATWIATGRPDLRLIRETVHYDSHKKKVLSDEFGCGMSFLVGSSVLGVTYFLDFHTATLLGWIDTHAPRSRQPDYLGICEGSSNDLILLEAKGSQSRGNYSRSQQIPSGCGQVGAVNISGAGSTIRARVVAATRLARVDTRDDSRVFLGDPEEREGYVYKFRRNPHDTLLLSHYLRIASFIGDTEVVQSLGEFGDRVKFEGHEQEVLGRRCLGSRLVIHHNRSAVVFFLGLDRAVREEVCEGRVSELPMLKDQSRVVEDRGHPASILRPDGTALSIRVESR